MVSVITRCELKSVGLMATLQLLGIFTSGSKACCHETGLWHKDNCQFKEEGVLRTVDVYEYDLVTPM